MTLWSTRTAMYKFSLVCAFLNFALFIVSFAVPLWLGKGGIIIGLWAEGTGDEEEIDSVEETGFDDGAIRKDWMDAVRGLWLAGAVLYLIGLIIGVVENYILTPPARDYGLTGLSILLAGLCGAAGVITLAVEIEDSDLIKLDYLWGYILGTVASGLAVILSIVILITKHFGYPPEMKSSRTADYVYAHKGPYMPDYNNPGYRHDDMPMGNGAPYHHHQHHHQPQHQHHHQAAPYSQSPYSMYRSGGGGGQDNSHFHGNKYEQNSGYYPYGYKDPRPGNRTSMAESTDLSNGFTPNFVNTENSLGRSRMDYGRSHQQPRGEFFYQGSRPY